MPALTWTWATNPGTRIAPSVGQQATGFVPSTPISAENVNYLIGQLRDAYSGTVTAFEVEHNGTTGVHTNITADTLSVDGGNFVVDSFGQVFSNVGIRLNGAAVDLNLSSVALGASAVFHKWMVNQPLPMGGFGLFTPGTIEEASFGSSPVTSIKLDPNEDGIFLLGELPFDSDLEELTLGFWVNGGVASYDLQWTLLQWDDAVGDWDTVITAAGNASAGGTGNLVGAPGGAQAWVTDTITFANLNGPTVAGVHFSTAANRLAIRIANLDGTDDAYIVSATAKIWITTLKRALGGF